jgi:HSP20 family molecular chaperone IbpA
MTRHLMPRTTPAFTTAFRELDDMQHRLRRFFNQTPGNDLFTTEAVGWMPPVEIVEKPDALMLTAELPGVTKEHIDVTFEDDVLTIRGEKTEARGQGGGEVPSLRALLRHVRSFVRRPAHHRCGEDRRSSVTACSWCVCPRPRRRWPRDARSR